jgi:hypothetical protein
MKKYFDMIPYALILILVGGSVIYLAGACKAQNEEAYRVVLSTPVCDDDEWVQPCDTGLPGNDDCTNGYQFCEENCDTGKVTCDKCSPDIPELCSPQ